jgi:hypothetical protein
MVLLRKNFEKKFAIRDMHKNTNRPGKSRNFNHKLGKLMT